MIAVTPVRTSSPLMIVLCPPATPATSVIALSGPVGRMPTFNPKSEVRGRSFGVVVWPKAAKVMDRITARIKVILEGAKQIGDRKTSLISGNAITRTRDVEIKALTFMNMIRRGLLLPRLGILEHLTADSQKGHDHAQTNRNSLECCALSICRLPRRNPRRHRGSRPAARGLREDSHICRSPQILRQAGDGHRRLPRHRIGF